MPENLIREAQRYASYLPDGIRLSGATLAQLVTAINEGRAEHGLPPMQDELIPASAMRVDPPHCDCRDCTAGRSVPMNEATNEDIRNLVVGAAENATGYEFRYTLIVRTDDLTRTPWTFQLTSDQAESGMRLPL